METISKKVTMRVLTPSEGYLLTQVADVEPQDRIYSGKVYLAVTDSPDNWTEITIEEVEKRRKAVQEKNDVPPVME